MNAFLISPFAAGSYSAPVTTFLGSADTAGMRTAMGLGTTDSPTFTSLTVTTTAGANVFSTGAAALQNAGFLGVARAINLIDTAGISWSSTSALLGATGTTLFQDGPGILAQRNGTAKQVHRVYNTFLGTTANEWGGFDWLTTGNVLRIGTDHAGTGGARDLQIITNGIARLTIQGNGNASFTNTVGFGGNVNVGYLLGLKSLLVSQLPAASGTAIFSLVGVSDATVTAAAGKGTTVVGGGANKVLVMNDGTNWVIL
jgi:hypothetical protein